MDTQTKTPAPITSLKDLQALCSKRHKVEFEFDGSPVSIEIRRLTPAEQARIAEIVDSVVPPIQKGKLPEEDRVNTLDPEYRKKKNLAIVEARSLAIYWAVPSFQEIEPGLTDPAAIAKVVQGALTEPILNALWDVLQDGGIKDGLVNFI